MISNSSKKTEAIVLRKAGRSLRQISEELCISKSTASLWVRNIELDEKALAKIKNSTLAGQQRAIQTRKLKKKMAQEEIKKAAGRVFTEMNPSKEFLKLVGAVLFWTEGSKSGSFVSFINSDSKMIELFLFTLRTAFKIDESKLRALVHFHEYHEESELKKYWSLVTGIPVNQFSKSYKKPNTGIRKKAGYLGSLRIRYYDVKVAQELTEIYTMLPEVLKHRVIM
ncbi:MAG: hypothetical protein BroJett025_00530 [Patescibacteria group bacterium]|nr:MAG: hypothetical protein BroJett025_00530 [Patescibacteria group bacterium]